MKKKIFFIGVAIMFLFLVAALAFCNRTVHWEFEKDCSEIKEIKIVEDLQDNDYNVPIDEELLWNNDYVVLCEVSPELFDDLYSDIEKIEMKSYGTNLAEHSGRFFVILFENGEYDVISLWEPQHYRYDENGVLQGDISWLRCNEEQFEALLDKYAP